METGAGNVGDTLVPSYAPYRTLPGLRQTLRQTGMPSHITRKAFKGKSWEQTQGMTMLRSMSLIDDEGIPQPRLIEFIEANTESERKAALRTILEEVYPYLFRDGGLIAATAEGLDEQFISRGVQQDTARKCRTFFLNALRDAGYPLPRELAPRQRNPKPRKKMMRRTPVPKATGQESNLGVAPYVKVPVPSEPEFDPKWPQEMQKLWLEAHLISKKIELLEKTQGGDEK